MRHLTIKRNKTFVGCAGKLRVYIEDAAATDFTINDVGCRKLGELKNGEEKTFEIEEGAAKVFVIADQLSKGFCNEYYQLSEGSEDIALTGQCRFNPAAGNAFRFENNNSADVLANRKKSTAKGSVILIISMVIGLIGGFLFSSFLLGGSLIVREKTFTSQGISITLTNEFKKVQVPGLAAAYESKYMVVCAQKETVEASVWESYSEERYMRAVIANNAEKFASVTETKSDGLVGFTYQAIDPGTEQMCNYYYYFFKSEEAFWTVHFAVLSKDAEKYEQNIFDWVKSVEFTK